MGSWLLLAAGLCGCGADEDACDAPAGSVLVAYVQVHVSDASTGKPLTPADGAGPAAPQGSLSLKCPDFPVKVVTWSPAIVAFDEPGPHDTTRTCTVTVAAVGYATWTKDVEQVYGKCGFGTKGYDLDVQLNPSP